MAISGPLPQVKAGSSAPSPVSSAKRIPALPDVPTFSRSGFSGRGGLHLGGVFLPAGTPAAPIVQKLNEAVNARHPQPEVRERLAFSASTRWGPQSSAAE